MAQPQRPGGFDMARMSTGQKVLLVVGILLFIILFLDWQSVDLGEFLGQDIGGVGASGFSGIGVIVAILVIAMIVWEGLLAAGVNINMGTTSPALIGAIIAAATALFTIIKFLASLDSVSWPAFIGLVLGLVIAYGAYLRFQESKVGGLPPPPAG
jgi:hypothetical protein